MFLWGQSSFTGTCSCNTPAADTGKKRMSFLSRKQQELQKDKENSFIYLHAPPVFSSLFLFYHLLSFPAIFLMTLRKAEQKAEVNMGHNWIVVKRGERANIFKLYCTTWTISQHVHWHVLPAHIFSLSCYSSCPGICRLVLTRLDDFGAQDVLPSALVPERASLLGFGKEHFPQTPVIITPAPGDDFLT